MVTFTYIPSHASRGQSTPRKLKTRFGDGYMQEAADGINPLLRVWNLTFAPIPKTDTDPNRTTLKKLNDFFEARDSGDFKFLWTQPVPFDIEGTKVFVCEQWDYVYDGGDAIGVTAVFEQR